MTYHPAAYLAPFYSVEWRERGDTHEDAWVCGGIYGSQEEADASPERLVCADVYEYRTAEVRVERVRVLEATEAVAVGNEAGTKFEREGSERT